jgi:hypothetical protein
VVLQGVVGLAAVPRTVNWFGEVAITAKIQPVFDAFAPLETRWAALPTEVADGQVREYETKASALVDVELVSIDGLNKCSAPVQPVCDVPPVRENNTEVPLVETL